MWVGLRCGIWNLVQVSRNPKSVVIAPKVAHLSLATNRSVKSATGYKQQTDWHNIVVWRSEKLGPYLTKGKQVFVEGRLQSKTYTDDGGKKRSRIEVVAENVILLSRDENGNGKAAANDPKGALGVSDNDTQF